MPRGGAILVSLSPAELHLLVLALEREAQRALEADLDLAADAYVLRVRQLRELPQ